MAGTAAPSATPNSGNTWLDGILWSTGWSSAGATAISVYIAGRAGDERVSLVGQTITAQSSISGAEIAAMRGAMNAVAAVADVTFVSAASQADADIIWASVNNADGEGALGWANPPGTVYSAAHGDHQSVVTVNHKAYSGAPSVGSFDYVTFIHEFGHALGLSHPHDRGGGSSIFPGVTAAFGDFGRFGMNQGIYTMMSYNDGWHTAPHGASPVSGYGYQGTPMALDIAALQFLYGANTTANAGNTVYTMPGANRAGTQYACIWDTAGIDTIKGAAGRANVIDLRAATLRNEAGGGGFVSYAAGIHGGFTIANGVTVENARGGSRGDTILGNGAANALAGAGGNDRLNSGRGNDTLQGGTGDDTLNAGRGADTLVFHGLFGDDVIRAGMDVSATDNVIRVGGHVTGSMISYALSGGAHLLITVAGKAIGQVGTILVEGWAAAQAAGGGLGSVVWTAGGGGTTDLTAALLAKRGGGSEPPQPSMTGTSGNDRLVGTANADTIAASSGRDRANGSAGQDTVHGGAGADSLFGGNDGDRLAGGGEDDRLFGDAGRDVVLGDWGRDRLEGGSENDLLSGGTGGDTLVGGAGSDTLVGGAGSDTLVGGAGSDTVDGGRSNDRALGGAGDDLVKGGAEAGADRLSGGSGRDTLHGGAGEDTLNGSSGDDVLAGGAGADIFIFSGAFGSDTVAGFNDTAERRQDGLDRIDLTDFRSSNREVLTTDDILLTRRGADVLLEFDLDGDGRADVRDLSGDGVPDRVSILILEATVGEFSSHDFLF